jgi:hypothetical protein
MLKKKNLNSLLYLIINNNIFLNKKNCQIFFKNKYLELLFFLKKNNLIYFFKKINFRLLIYFKYFENIAILKNIKIYNHFENNKILSLNKILQIKKNNSFNIYIFYNKIKFLTIDEVIKNKKGAYLLAKFY